MTPELRAALRLVLEAYPAGSVAPMLREHALELLEATPTQPGASGSPPADLTLKELGARLHRNPSTVRAWCEAGRFPGAYRFERREWRVPVAGLAAFEQAQRSGGAKPTPQGGRKVTDLGAWRKTAS